MGTLAHGDFTVDFEDRLLAHLQVAVIKKFRRNEAFVLSWLEPLSGGDGRSSVWMTPNLPVIFKFAGSRVPTINERWLQALTDSSNSSTGLIVLAENGEYARSSSPIRLR